MNITIESFVVSIPHVRIRAMVMKETAEFFAKMSSDVKEGLGQDVWQYAYRGVTGFNSTYSDSLPIREEINSEIERFGKPNGTRGLTPITLEMREHCWRIVEEFAENRDIAVHEVIRAALQKRLIQIGEFERGSASRVHRKGARS